MFETMLILLRTSSASGPAPGLPFDGPPAWFDAAVIAAVNAAIGSAVSAAVGPAVSAAVGPAVSAALEPLRRDFIRARNSSALQPHDVLVPLPGEGGEVPAHRFPSTLREISLLSSPTTTELLTFYGLSTGGHLRVKRRRLAEHIGVRNYQE
jgi:hypothetical protein